MTLSPGDLAYMRETQAGTRPTAAELIRQAKPTPDGMGGKTRNPEAPEPIQVRLDGAAKAPAALIEEHGSDLVRITTDLVPMRPKDVIQVSATEAYEVVTETDTDDWVTAQVVWGVRTAWPAP